MAITVIIDSRLPKSKPRTIKTQQCFCGRSCAIGGAFIQHAKKCKWYKKAAFNPAIFG